MTKTSRIRLLAISCALGLATGAPAGVVLSRAEAIDAVAAELAPGFLWSPFEDLGFGSGFEGLLPPGSTVRPFALDNQPHPGNLTTLVGPMYLFWEDLGPEQRYPHATRFIYVDATASTPSLADGTIVVQEQGWWPIATLRDGVDRSFFGPDRPTSALPGGAANPDGLVLGVFAQCGDTEPAAGSPAGGPPPTLGENPCVIVLRGNDDRVDTNGNGMIDDGDETMSQNDVELIRQAFIDRGVPASRVLTAPDHGVATKAVLESLVEQVCNAEPPCDHIYLAISSHGGQGTDGDGECVSGVWLGDHWIPVENADDPECSLCALLGPLGAKGVPVDMLFDVCFGGKLVSALREAKDDDGDPKFPLGTIMSSTGDNDFATESDIRNMPSGPIRGWHGQFTWAFVRCWNNPEADTDGDDRVSWAEAFKWVCEGDNGEIDRCDGDGTPRVSDVKDQHPAKEGLPEHREEQAEDGNTYVLVRTDTDCDGRYDTTESECTGPAGTPAFRGKSSNPREDDWPASSESEMDNDGDGVFERRYAFAAGPFCQWGVLVCYVWKDSAWVPEAELPQSSTAPLPVEPESGPTTGGTGFAIEGEWNADNHQIKVFFDAAPAKELIVTDGLISGVTPYQPVGVVTVTIADFDEGSPTFGMHVLAEAFEFLPELRVTRVGPSPLECFEQSAIVVHGDGFDKTAQVSVDGAPALVTGFSDPQTLLAILPGLFCDEAVDLTVSQEGATGPLTATLFDALHFRPQRDLAAPQLDCPPKQVVIADPDGLARLGPEYTATAVDDLGTARVFRNTLGALAVGDHVVEFETTDEVGNRGTCEAIVIVDPPLPCAGDVTGDGTVDVDDLVETILSWGPCPPEPKPCPADLDGSGAVDVDDLVAVIVSWGGCG